MPVQQIVECPLLAPNSQAPDTATPPGRIKKLGNGVVTKFENGRLKVGARDGFRQLTKSINNPDPAHFGQVSSTGFASLPTLLNSFRDQLVVVADQKPHVLAEDAPSWSQLPYAISTASLKQDPFYTATHSISCPDAAAINGVVCYVWKETNETTGIETAFVSIRDSDGTPLRLPAGIADSDTNAPVVVKVVADNANFWVFNSAGTLMQVFVFDRLGALLIQYTFATLGVVEGPPNLAARWDVTCDWTGIVKWFGQTSSAPTLINLSLTLSPPTVHVTSYNMTLPFGVVDAFGAVAWLTNEFDDLHSYLAIYSYTYGLHTFSLTNYGALEHHYTVNTSTPTLDAMQLAGYVSTDLMAHVFLSIQDTTVNYTATYDCNTSDVVTQATRFSITIASRTFYLGNIATNVCYYTDPSGQSTFFLYDWATGQVIGCWSHGFAAQDWQNSPANQGYLSRENFSSPSVYVDNSGHPHIPVGYLAETFVRGVIEDQNATNGKFQSVTVKKWVSNVGLADVSIGADGEAVEYADTLLMPGPLANDFTGATFQEDNFCLYPAPFTIVPSHSDAGNLTPGPYTYILCWAWTDSNGNRVRSRPSDPVGVTMGGGGTNVNTLHIPTLFMTNKTDVTLEVYRSYHVAGVESTERRKITDDLKPIINNKAVTTIIWSDNNNDATAQFGQELYTDTGLLPHDAMPAFSTGCVAGARVFGVGPDGAVYFSNEKVPVEPLTFNVDVLRMTPPSSDPIVQLKSLDSGRVILLCKESVWEWDVTQLPGPDGLGGNVRTPTVLQGFSGCTGRAKLISEGIVYSSETGPWLVARSLENKFIGAPVVAELSGHDIVGFAQDHKQRMMIGVNGYYDASVRDAISGVWSTFTLPSAVVLVHQWHNRLCYADSDSVRFQEDGLTNDVYVGHSDPIVLDIQSDPIQIGTIKGMKVLWASLVTGVYIGPHRLLVDFDYLTEDGIISESFVIIPTADGGFYGFGTYGTGVYGVTGDCQYEYEFQPIVEEVESVSIRLRSDFAGIADPGPSFELELLSFQIGVDSKLTRTPPTIRRGQSA